MADNRSIQRQPDKLDYASPTQFKFGIHQLPKVEFFTVAVNVPAINIGITYYPTALKDIPMMGDKVTYDNLTVSFMVDEYLENYLSLHEWITGIGFPKDRKQFSDFRTASASMPGKETKQTTDLKTGQASSVLPMFSDATLTILSNKNNPIIQIFFQDMFPVSLSGLEYNQDATDVEYIKAEAEFAYNIYEITSV